MWKKISVSVADSVKILSKTHNITTPKAMEKLSKIAVDSLLFYPAKGKGGVLGFVSKTH